MAREEGGSRGEGDSSPEIAPAHYLGRSKVTLLSPTLSTQTQAEKPIGKGRTVTPPHISDKCVRKTWFHSPPNSPPRGERVLPTMVYELFGTCHFGRGEGALG